MKGKSHPATLLIEANEALQDGRWEDARRLYQQFLDLEPHHAEAQRALSRLDRLEITDQSVRDLIQQGDEHFQAGDYKEALDTYTQALNQAGHAGILKYHAQLEQKRNQARDLAAWRERVRQALQEARGCRKKGDSKAALQPLDRVLQELPEADPYQAMVVELRKLQKDVMEAIGAEELYQQALEASRAQDFEQAIRLAEAIPSQSSLCQEAQRIIVPRARDCLRKIEPILQQAEAAFHEGRWADALAELDTLREQYPGSPAWRRLWLHVVMERGLEALDEGRQANGHRDFQAAQRYFEQACKAFEKALEVYPTHATAPALQDEAVDLIQIAIEEAQAHTDWEAGRREEGRVALERASSRIEHARSEGRDYAAVAAVVETMHQTLKGEIQRIQEEERRLQDGERLLTKERRLAEAAERFRETLNALLPEYQRQAADGLSRAEAEMRRFEDEMEQGRKAADPFAAAEAFQAAHSRWPDGPKVAEVLEAALVKAGERTLEAGREKEAISYFRQVLELNRDNRRAQLGLEKPGVGAQVAAALEQAQADLERLSRQPETKAEDFRTIVTDLERVHTQARPFPDLVEQIEGLRRAASERHKQWQAYERLYRQAQAAQQAGAWEKAAEQLGQALTKLEEIVPAALQQRLEDWQAAARAVRDAHRSGSAALTQAQKAYARTPEGSELGAVLDALAPAEAALRAAEEAVRAAQGPLPRDIEALRQKADDLHRRAEAALEAVNSPLARDGLLKVREIIRLRGSDSTLEALAQRLEGQVRSEAPVLLQRAEPLIEEGRLTEALDLLRQVHELQPDEPEIAARYAQLQQRTRLEERLREAEADYRQKLATDSPVDARDALRRGLNVLLEPGTGLPEEVQTALLELIQLSEQKLGLALGYPEEWEEGRNLLARLGRMGTQHILAGRAYYLADLWAKLAHDVAMRGVIESAAKLGKLLDAYRAAAIYTQAHPTEPDAAALLAQTSEELLRRHNESVTKRLERAREALRESLYPTALSNLAAVEEEFYGPIAQEFPDLLEKEPQVEQLRREAERLQAQAERLQALHEQVQPYLLAAEQAFVNGDLEAAEAELRAVPDLMEAPDLAQRVEGLRGRIAQTRIEQARQALYEALTTAQIGLRLTTTREQFDDLSEALGDVSRRVNLRLLPVEERVAYYQMLDEVREQRETLVGGATWEAQAEQALQAGNYLQAAAALEKAVAATREGDKRVQLQTRLEEVQGLAQRQREREEALRRGDGLFRQGEYVQARLELLRAQGLGAGVDDLLEAARTGALLASAQRAWEEEKDWEGAQLDLEEALALAGENPEAKEIVQEARRFQRHLKAQAGLEIELNAARLALEAGDLDSAQASIEAVLKRAPGHKEALALQEQVGRTRRAQAMLQEAREAMGGGDYKTALATVETILEKLPDYSNAVVLRQQIEIGQQANEALVRAETLAHNRQFQEARQALQEAMNLEADPNRLRKAQDLVDQEEETWATETTRSIQEFLHDGKYPEALRLCKQSLALAAVPNVRLDMENLQAEVVNRWVEKDLEALQRQLKQAGDEAALGEIVVELERLATLEPAPAAHLIRETGSLRRQAHTGRLGCRLSQARQQAEQANQQAEQGARQAALETCKEALGLLQKVREEADTMGLGDIVFQAAALEIEVDEHRRHVEKQQDQEIRDRLLSEVQTLLQKPSDRADLERACDLLRQVLEIPRFKRERDVNKLLQQAEATLQLFNETETALQRSRELVRQRRFREAETALRLPEVVPLLKDDYDRQRDLVRLLRQTERDYEREDWKAALAGYRQALQQMPDLEPLLEADLERCCQRLMDDVIAQVQQALEAIPAKPDQARAILDQAEAAGWSTPASASTVARLRGWIASQEYVAQAASLLEQEEGDPAQALEALKEAYRLLPDGQSDEPVRQWEYLAQALLAWHRSDLEQAESALKTLEPPVADVARARQLGQVLTLACQIEEALAGQRYHDAVDAVRQVVDLAGSDPRVQQLCHSTQTYLQTSLEATRQVGHYAEAIELGDALRRMAPEDEDIRHLVEGLPGERREQLEQAIRQVEATLRTYDLGQAENMLRWAETIASPDRDRRIGKLQERLKQQYEVLEQADKWLREVETFVERSEWEPAIERLLEARQKAPTYPRLVGVTTELQDRFCSLARTHLEAEHFAQALTECDLALRLEPRNDLTDLRREIVSIREARLAKQRGQVRHALEVWDLETAQEALEQGRLIASDDRGLGRLQEQVQQMEDLIPDLQRSMEAGWQTLQERDYPAAREAFGQTLETASSFNFNEASLWRDYTDEMEQAVQRVEKENEFQAATRFLEMAGNALAIGRDERLPSILGSKERLRERRRQAVYDAHRLRQAALRMATLYEQSRQAREQGSLEQARDLLNQLTEERRAFLYMHRTPAVPPEDFPAETAPYFQEVAPSSPSALEPPLPAQEQPEMEALVAAPLEPSVSSPKSAKVKKPSKPRLRLETESKLEPRPEPEPGQEPALPPESSRPRQPESELPAELAQPSEAEPKPPTEPAQTPASAPTPAEPEEPLAPLDWKSVLSGFSVASYDEEDKEKE